ncbi:MAG: serine/threonine protein kinase [Verrucomicrobiaceae bacterium]|nr:serine/threonine protein kinase [Verrucomicrobiaceae bacterium]
MHFRPVVLPEQQYLSQCPACGAQIDVTALEPFAKIQCPSCREAVRVRRRFDQFAIVREIGEGGMSRVFEAEDETLGRRVALKILNRKYSGDLTRMAQFQQEALTTARVTHPNVIKLYSVGFDQGHFFIAMELVSGGSLEQKIRREGEVKEKEVLRIGRQVAEGLRAAHRMGLLHRDVKPANILFTDEGTAKVVDFGLALFIQQKDQSGEIWATPYYVSPEKVIENKEDFRSDLFSLGASLYHALTGHPPHKVKSASLHELRMVKCRRITLQDSPKPFGVRTVKIIDELLAFSPDERPASYDEAVDELRLAEGLINKPLISLASKRRKIAAVAAVAMLVAFLSGWLFQSANDQEIRDASADEAARRSLTGGGVTQPDVSTLTKAERFLAARKAVAAGDFDTARPVLETLLSEGVMQPTMNWVRFHAALCALARSDRYRAATLFQQLAVDSPGEDTASRFLRTVGDRHQQDLGLKLPSDALRVDPTNEDVLSYIAHGIAQWYFGDFRQGAASFRKFLEVTNTPHAQAWIQDCRTMADLFDQEAAMAEGLLASASKQPIADPGMLVDALQTVKDRLKTGGLLKREVEQQLAAVKTLTQSKGRTSGVSAKIKLALERRGRELHQLVELVESLPALVRGFDYQPAIHVLKSMKFESPEVRTALEGRQYLYENAESFINQLFRDLERRGWNGMLRRRDSSALNGTVRFGSLSELRVQLERGEVSIPLSTVPPEMLLEIADSLKKDVSDSTEVYRREELMAAFAKINGLEEQAAAISTLLMEENRGFRVRWMKVLQGGI